MIFSISWIGFVDKIVSFFPTIFMRKIEISFVIARTMLCFCNIEYMYNLAHVFVYYFC